MKISCKRQQIIHIILVTGVFIGLSIVRIEQPSIVEISSSIIDFSVNFHGLPKDFFHGWRILIRGLLSCFLKLVFFQKLLTSSLGADNNFYNFCSTKLRTSLSDWNRTVKSLKLLGDDNTFGLSRLGSVVSLIEERYCKGFIK